MRDKDTQLIWEASTDKYQGGPDWRFKTKLSKQDHEEKKRLNRIQSQKNREKREAKREAKKANVEREPEVITVSREHFAEIQVKLGNWLNEKGAVTVPAPLDFQQTILDDMGDNDAAIRLEIVTDWFEATGKVHSNVPTQDIFKIYSGDPIYFSDEQQKVIDFMSPTKHWKDDPNMGSRSMGSRITILNDERRRASIVYGGTLEPEPSSPITTEVITEYVNGLLSEYGYGKGYKEGEKKGQTVDVRKRSQGLIARAKWENKERYGFLTCEKCKLQPAKDYYHQGQKVSENLADRIIEGHHKKGVQEIEATTADIQCLCNNCHIYETQKRIINI